MGSCGGPGRRCTRMPVEASMCCFFFFQAEDGIRDYKVTGVQTCALPISALWAGNKSSAIFSLSYCRAPHLEICRLTQMELLILGRRDRRYQTLSRRKERSEERRVGKECRSRWSPYH